MQLYEMTYQVIRSGGNETGGIMPQPPTSRAPSAGLEHLCHHL